MSMRTFGCWCLDCGWADLFDSYEGLPPDYTLGHNMLAGAFAGIAVRFFAPDHKLYIKTHQRTGTLCDVPCRLVEGSRCCWTTLGLD